MSSLSRELVFLILQFLDEEEFKESVHKLEQESGFFFNMSSFENMVTNGDWEEVEKYLSGFTKVDDNRQSMKMFFEIRKQKYLEALDKRDRAKAAEILVKDLKVFAAYNEELFKEITQLLTLDDFRDHEQLSKYGDTESARSILLAELKNLIEANPLFRDKLQFPILNKNSRLRTLINQSLNWQHQLCNNPRPNPDIKTLFVDHICKQPNHSHYLMEAGGFPPLGGAHGPFPLPISLANNAAMLKRPRTPPTNNPAMDYETADSEHVMKRSRTFGVTEEANNLPVNRIWKLTEISEQSQCRSLRLHDNLTAMRVSRLTYTNSGLAILALSSNAVHKLWKWQRNDISTTTTGKATASIVPQLWKPASGTLMTNDISDTNPEDAVACFALSKNDSYVMSASGGEITLFNMMTFKTMTTFMPPTPAATYLAFHPLDNNIVAIGMEDSSIQIYNVQIDEVKIKLKGHQKRITGLAFSHHLNVLVSSGADSQLCVWSTKDEWEKQTSKFLQIPNGRGAAPLADTRVQFHSDQIHLLAVHETQIAIYEAPKLQCLKQWVPSGPITHATYSCDSQSIYVSFEDGGVGVLIASNLRLRCRILPAAYLPRNPSLRVYPLVVAAHPSDPNQFALGLTDGGVHVLEPLESDGKWGTIPPTENTTSGAAAADQPQR